MEQINFGATGLKVSRLCLGTMSYGDPGWRDWVLDRDAALPFYRRAWEAGITFFDTADMYSMGVSEEVLGWALRRLGIAREQVVIGTKCFSPMGPGANQRGTNKKHVKHAAEASLQRLGVDYVDLFQIHRHDATTPIEETIEALGDLVREGKALYVGASSMHAWQFAKSLHTADAMGAARYVSMQNHYNLVYREEERDMLPLCEAEGVAVMPWSALARGLLARTAETTQRKETARAKADPVAETLYAYDETDYAIVGEVEAIAAERGVNMAQVALAWLLSKPAVTTPIVGATRLSQLDDAIAAVDLELTKDEIARLEAPYRPREVTWTMM